MARDQSAVQAAARRATEIRSPCLSLLEDVVVALGARRGALYSVEGGEVALVVSAAPPGVPAGMGLVGAELIARQARATGRPELRPLDAASAEGRRDVFAAPIALEGAIAAVVVAELTPGALGVDEAVARMGSTLPLALAVDRARVRAALEERLSQAEAVKRQLDAYAIDLRSTFLAERERSEQLSATLIELQRAYESTVRALATAVESKDAYTGGHLQRVSKFGMAVTRLVAPDHADDLQFEYGFLLHDVGKLVVPDEVLGKRGPLDERELELIRLHPEAGRTILDGIAFLEQAKEIVFAHHEHWDGSGYPRGLRGAEIPLGARIFPLADAFDAMTSNRPYRTAMSTDVAFAELERFAGAQFWPQAVDAFTSLPVDELESIRGHEPGAMS